jgi:hypothetical protein
MSNLRPSACRFSLCMLLGVAWIALSADAHVARAQTDVQVETLANWTVTPSALGDSQLALRFLSVPATDDPGAEFVAPAMAFPTLWILQVGSAVVRGSGPLLYGAAPASPDSLSPADTEIAAGAGVTLSIGDHVGVSAGVELSISEFATSSPAFYIISLEEKLAPPIPPGVTEDVPLDPPPGDSAVDNVSGEPPPIPDLSGTLPPELPSDPPSDVTPPAIPEGFADVTPLAADSLPPLTPPADTLPSNYLPSSSELCRQARLLVCAETLPGDSPPPLPSDPSTVLVSGNIGSVTGPKRLKLFAVTFPVGATSPVLNSAGALAGYLESGFLTLSIDRGVADVVSWPQESGGLPPHVEQISAGTQIVLNAQSSLFLMPGSVVTASADGGEARLLVVSVISN